jgi:hypothetical protein
MVMMNGTYNWERKAESHTKFFWGIILQGHEKLEIQEGRERIKYEDIFLETSYS